MIENIKEASGDLEFSMSDLLTSGNFSTTTMIATNSLVFNDLVKTGQENTCYVGDNRNLDVTNVVIPSYYTDQNGENYKVIGISNNAFNNNLKIETIVIPEGIIEIGIATFSGCVMLKEIFIPSSITTIPDAVFRGTIGLRKITVSENNKVYDSRNDCNAIIETSTNRLIVGSSDTIIPNDVEIIGNYAFYGLTELETIIIPSSVNSIEYEAFYQCTNLTSINIPKSITSIGESAFSGCSKLENVIFELGIQLESISKNLFQSSGIKTITIPASVKTIADGAFAYCEYLLTVEFEDESSQLLSIGVHAFYNCKLLTKIILPNSLTEIKNSAFENCLSLEAIVIPETINNIGSSENYLNPFNTCYAKTVIYVVGSINQAPSLWNRESWFLLQTDNTVLAPIVWGCKLDSNKMLAEYTTLEGIATIPDTLIPDNKYPVTLKVNSDIVKVIITDDLTDIKNPEIPDDFITAGYTSFAYWVDRENQIITTENSKITISTELNAVFVKEEIEIIDLFYIIYTDNIIEENIECDVDNYFNFILTCRQYSIVLNDDYFTVDPLTTGFSFYTTAEFNEANKITTTSVLTNIKLFLDDFPLIEVEYTNNIVIYVEIDTPNHEKLRFEIKTTDPLGFGLLSYEITEIS